MVFLISERRTITTVSVNIITLSVAVATCMSTRLH